MRNRGINIEVRATIGKRIRGDIDDAHHARAIQREGAACAIELRSEIEHSGNDLRMRAKQTNSRRDDFALRGTRVGWTMQLWPVATLLTTRLRVTAWVAPG